MKEIRSIVNAYYAVGVSKQKAALASVVHIEGSSYRRVGARMLILHDGSYIGGISGGCLEGDALRKAQYAIVQNTDSIVRYDTTQEDDAQIGVGLGCNGIIDVLFTPLDGNLTNNPMAILSGLTGRRDPALLVNVTYYTTEKKLISKLLVFENDSQFADTFPIKELASTVVKDAKQSLEHSQSEARTYLSTEGEVRVFMEVIMPLPRLIIYGGNYDVMPLLNIGRELGWETLVFTHVRKAKKQLFALADRVLDVQNECNALTDRFTAVVLMSHDYETDFNNLDKVLGSNASYIGLLGPRKRSEKMFDRFHLMGKTWTQEQINRVYSPAGLDIGAATPEEIALSIAAEIQAHFACRPGGSLRERKGAIHSRN